MYHVMHSDALEALRELPDCSVDSIVTDPPAGIAFMGQSWDKDKGGRDAWVAWLRGVMAEALRVLKPGGHALVWALPRTSHWTATAIEDAGFEIRDVGVHLFGTGFPKSLNVSKAIAEIPGTPYVEDSVYVPAIGFGTALKPAAEHWILARKPLAGTVARNVLEYGTGALNVDGCRIPHGADVDLSQRQRQQTAEGNIAFSAGMVGTDIATYKEGGRWPANVTLDPEAAAMLDEQSGTLTSGLMKAGTKRHNPMGYGGAMPEHTAKETIGDSGGASRFFYVARPSTREREAGCEGLPRKGAAELTDREEGTDGLKSPRAGAGRTSAGRANHHPTVKSIALMRWLVRLITPPGGLVLDPFCGSGTTGCAAVLEGMHFIGIDQSDEYVAIATARIGHWEAA